MDPCSLDVLRDGKNIGSIQWHKERSPRLVISYNLTHLTLDELKQITKYLEEYETS
jgi:hypothetical protein